VLRMVPVGTHEWERFVTPEELEGAMARAGTSLQLINGMVLNPVTGSWFLHPSQTGVNSSSGVPNKLVKGLVTYRR